jgi:hypothetical protein
MTNDSKIIDMRRLDFSRNYFYKPVCGVVGEIPGYPHNVILALNRPFTIERIPVRPEIARMYLEQMADDVSLLPNALQITQYKRSAFLRLRVHLTKYKETVFTSSGVRAVVFGTVDGVEVYADLQKTKPMYVSTVSDKRIRRFHRGSNAEGVNFGADPPRMPIQNQAVTSGQGSSAAGTQAPAQNGQVDISPDETSQDYDTGYDHAVTAPSQPPQSAGDAYSSGSVTTKTSIPPPDAAVYSSDPGPAPPAAPAQ